MITLKQLFLFPYYILKFQFTIYSLVKKIERNEILTLTELYVLKLFLKSIIRDLKNEK